MKTGRSDKRSASGDPLAPCDCRANGEWDGYRDSGQLHVPLKLSRIFGLHPQDSAISRVVSSSSQTDDWPASGYSQLVQHLVRIDRHGVFDQQQ